MHIDRRVEGEGGTPDRNTFLFTLTRGETLWRGVASNKNTSKNIDARGRGGGRGGPGEYL